MPHRNRVDALRAWKVIHLCDQLPEANVDAATLGGFAALVRRRITQVAAADEASGDHAPVTALRLLSVFRMLVLFPLGDGGVPLSADRRRDGNGDTPQYSFVFDCVAPDLSNVIIDLVFDLIYLLNNL